MIIIKHPISTEKSLMMMETDNKLVFIVDINANKKQIEEEMEERFGKEVENVNTLVDSKGRKKAYVKFKKDGAALDIATKLGLM